MVSLAWGNDSSVDSLFKMQKRAIRIINKLPYRAHTDPLFRKNHIMKVKDIYKLQCSIFSFDYIHDNLPKSFINYFRMVSSEGITTRQSNNLYVNRARTKFSDSMFPNQAPKVWNSLSNELKRLEKRNSFAKKLKKGSF